MMYGMMYGVMYGVMYVLSFAIKDKNEVASYTLIFLRMRVDFYAT